MLKLPEHHHPLKYEAGVWVDRCTSQCLFSCGLLFFLIVVFVWFLTHYFHFA